MSIKSALLILVLALSICVSACASENQSITQPTLDLSEYTNSDGYACDVHNLLGFSYIFIDATDIANIDHAILPVRDITGHFNILRFLEDGPCTDCFSIAGITPSGTGTLLVDIEVASPFPNPNFTGFDVRGIAMFNAQFDFPDSGLNYSDRNLGDGQVIDPDGFTTLYNSTTVGSGPAGLEGYNKGAFATATAPDGLLNAYMRFITNNPTNTRNAFYAGDTITVTYEVDMPDTTFVFGYALDASWVPATIPVIDPIVDFPPEANCPEPYRIDVSATSISLFSDAQVTIDVYDWQGKASHSAPVLECPGIFSGGVTADFNSDGAGFTQYHATITNDLGASAGTYTCLVGVEDSENDPVAKPWLDLTGYQIIDIEVYDGFDLSDVTPDYLNGTTEDYEVSGNNLFIASNFHGIQVYDITDPSNPLWIKNIDTSKQCWDITISGDYLYSASYGSDLEIVNINPIESASVISSFSVDGAAFRIDNDGATIYMSCATYPDGVMHIIDVSDPMSPSLENSVVFSGNIREVKYFNGYAYQTSGTDGLHIIDVDPPATAAIVNTIDTGSACSYIEVAGSYAYASAGMGGFHIIDINSPDTAVIDHTVLGVNPHGVDISGGYAFVADGSDGVAIIDIDPVGLASVVNNVALPGSTSECRVNGTTLFAGSDGMTSTIDIGDPLSATILGEIYYPGNVKHIAVSGDRAFVANSHNGLLILDISDPESTSVNNNIDTQVTDVVEIEGDYAYTLGSTGFLIIDISVPGSETVINTIPFSGSRCNITISGGYAYVSAGIDGLMIYDIDPPASLSLLTTVATVMGAQDVEIVGAYAYIAEEDYPDGILEVVDIDPPVTASVVHTVVLSGEGWGVDAKGNYLYIANDEAGFTVVDITDPLAASVVSNLDITGNTALDVDISGNYALVCDYSKGLVVIDISNPLAPVEIDDLAPVGHRLHIKVQDNYAYLTCCDGGVGIIKLD